MSAGDDLVASIRACVASRRDRARAEQQQAYMKSILPFQGWASADLSKALRPVLTELRIADRDDWEHAVLLLWDEAAVREHWYAALALLRHRHYRSWRDPDLLPTLRHLVESGAWWDVVDEIASHLVGGILHTHPETVTPIMRQWSRDEHLWVRRTAVLSQLRRRADTDAVLLGDVLVANLEGSPYGSQFFIRKAVGWALRQHAYTDPDWVRAFVRQNAERLSPLSRREALKHIGEA